MAIINTTTRKSGFLRVTAVLIGIVLVLVVLDFLNEGVRTLHELSRVEAERDQWQRPADVLRALDLRPGQVTVDLGAGAGYFALKISPAVGGGGRVLAVDLRRLSLTFLWIRSHLQSPHNVSVLVGKTDNPGLGMAIADSVLIANTYHELEDPPLMLSHLFAALRPGGRLVVVDRAPGSSDDPVGPAAPSGHEIEATQVEQELTSSGFEVLSSDHEFIHHSGDKWWLIVACKP